MKRRTYLAGLGAAGLGFGLGTQAAVDIWADRNTNISVTTDANGLLGLEPGDENGQFVDQDGAISIDLSAGSGSAEGLNPQTRTTIDDIFRIRNQAGDNQVVWIKDIVDDGADLFGDEGPLHFFRGPVSVGNFDTDARRITSQIDPVPGTPNDLQRLTIVGLVPPIANIGREAGDARKAWIESGHPITLLDRVDEIDQSIRRDKPITEYTEGVDLDPDVVVGNRKGRYFLEPGEEMIVGLDADFREFEDVTIELDEIQIVARSEEDAIALAEGEFDATA